MADINVIMLKEELYKVASALFRMGETCVEASKQHISESDALNKIRDYLNDAEMWSRFKVDQLIENCMEPQVYNTLDELDSDWLRKYLNEQPLQVYDKSYPSIEINFPSVCDECSNNPKNGGSGICHCTLPYFSDSNNVT